MLIIFKKNKLLIKNDLKYFVSFNFRIDNIFDYFKIIEFILVIWESILLFK